MKKEKNVWIWGKEDLYITQMKYTPIFLNENRKKRRKLCAYCTKICVKIITHMDKVQK